MHFNQAFKEDILSIIWDIIIKDSYYYWVYIYKSYVFRDVHTFACINKYIYHTGKDKIQKLLLSILKKNSICLCCQIR